MRINGFPYGSAPKRTIRLFHRATIAQPDGTNWTTCGLVRYIRCMSEGGPEKKMAAGRKRAVPSVKSEVGRAQVEQARAWVRRHYDVRAEIGHPRQDLRWTEKVRGYCDAHSSAVQAAITIIAESNFIREIEPAPEPQYSEIISKGRLAMGIGLPNENVAELIKMTGVTHCNDEFFVG
jgi:hypothetical protein